MGNCENLIKNNKPFIFRNHSQLTIHLNSISRPTLMPSFNYIDGLVSTGNQIPFTILKRIFSKRKKYDTYFIHNFFWRVDKDAMFEVKK